MPLTGIEGVDQINGANEASENQMPPEILEVVSNGAETVNSIIPSPAEALKRDMEIQNKIDEELFKQKQQRVLN